MKKKIIIVVVLILVVAGAFWAKGYYNDRYVASDFFYTQVPKDEVNEDSWLDDDDGVKQQKGKAYELVGYNEKGEDREVYFIVKGTAENYYAPGTYIKVTTSKTITLGQEVIQESSVPQAALDSIINNGTKVQ